MYCTLITTSLLLPLLPWVASAALPASPTSVAVSPETTPVESAIDGLSISAARRRPPPGWGRSEKNVFDTQQVGEPHGNPFSDKDYVSAAHGHRRIAKITLAGCEKGSHVSYLHFGFRDNSIDDDDRIASGSGHGAFKKGQLVTEHYLDKTEYIMEVYLTTWKAKVGFNDYRTRIGWIKFITSTGINWECGSFSDTDPYYEFKKAFYGLLYMSGSAGHALDALTGHFVSQSQI